MLKSPIKFDDLLKAVDTLSPEEKRLLRERLDKSDWSSRFGKALTELQADVPTGISEEEVQADIEEAIETVRTAQTLRILDLHPGAMWTSDDFDDPLPDEFWLGEDK